MPERLQRSPERREAPANVEWEQLLEVALTVPGSLGRTYSRFYNYSFRNQILLYMQGVTEPVNTFARWKDMNRQVQKGSKAKAILRPIMGKEVEDGVEQRVVKGFKMVNCLFAVSDTEGESLPDVEPVDWNPDTALTNLGIEEVPFESLDGNCQGMSYDRKFSINPVAAYPMKTMFHEIGHIQLGHTDRDGLADYKQHRGTKEFQAEAVAYLCMNELDVANAMDASESRAYVQTWLRGRRPDDAAIKQVFSAVDGILKAGRTSL